MKTGITETKELLDFGFDLQEAISSSLSDGKITLADAPTFFSTLMGSATAFGGIQKVTGELLDMDDTEKEELLSHVRSRFDLPDDVLEILIEDTIGSIMGLYQIALRWANRKNGADVADEA